MRKLLTLAHAERLALELSGGDLAKGIERATGWLNGLEGPDLAGAEVATLRYTLGTAAIAQAEPLGERDPKRRRMLTDARDLLGESAREPSEVQPAARAEWARVATLLGIDTSEPTDFADAYARGKDAIATLAATRVRIEDEGSSDALVAQSAESREAARTAYEAAIKLAKPREDAAKLNEARYFLAWLDWDAGDDAKAAAKAEYVATKFADDPSAELAARVGLAALERLSEQVAAEGRAAHAARVERFAAFAAERWPDGDTASAAFALRLAEALRDGRIEDAERVVASAPEGRRADLEVRLAVASWERAASDKSLPTDRLDAIVDRLERAVGQPAEGKVSPTRVAGVLYLAQGWLDRRRAAEAVGLLTRAADGPYALLLEGTPPTDTPRFAQEAARTSARAFALAGDDRANDALDRLTAALEGAEPAERVRGLVAVGARLQQDLARVTDNGRRGEATSVIERVAQQVATLTKDAPQEWNVSLWVAQVSSQAADAKPPGPERDAALGVARDAYNALAERAEREPGFAPSPGAPLAARIAGADCARKLGDNAAAYAAYKRVLEQRNALLDAQRQAAGALQAWGSADGDPQRLEQAIQGAERGADGKNVVWGWAKLAAVAAQAARTDPARQDLFYEAWLNVARSRYQVAKVVTGPQREEQLRKATSTIRAMQRQYPDLGGAERRGEFEALLRDVQAASAADAGGAES
ncbi:MAG: hypothetical protein ACRCT8_14210 [Lacipirellulaceae bacterium]